jgi:hypothetical protein
MDNGYIDNGTRMFGGHNGKNYDMWNLRMKVFIKSRGYDVWDSVVSRYTTSKKPPKTVAKRELKRNKNMEMYFILEGLSDQVKDKVGQCSLTKRFGIRYIISTIRDLIL